MKATIFGKKEGDRVRFWIGVSTKDRDGNYINSTINASLSREAEKTFMDLREDTKSADIKKAVVEIKDFWFKAVQGKEKTFTIVFVNEMTKAKASQGGDW